MSTITREQVQKIIEAADEVITALAGTNEDVHPESDNMLRLWDDLNDRYAPPEVVRELARIALASLEAEPVAWMWEIYGGGHMYAKIKPSSLDATPLYTAPPAPVSVPDDVMAAMQKVARIRLDLNDFDGDKRGILDCLSDAEENLIEVVNRRAAMLQGAEPDFREISNSSTKHFRENTETSTKCWCRTCRPVTISDMRFVVCPDCGNKRCPHANDHRNACTGSNEPGQEGSAYPAAPQHEVKNG